MERIESHISNAEIKRVFLKALRSGQFNQVDLEHFFKRVYNEYDSRYPTNTQWCYRYVSKKYTKQISEELREQRKRNKQDIEELENLY